MAGARFPLLRRIDEDAALRVVTELEALGLLVVVEPNQPTEDSILTLDQALAPEAELDPDELHEEEPGEPAGTLERRLMSLDGEAEGSSGRAPAAETTRPATPPPPSLPVTGDEARFRPPSEAGAAAELQLEPRDAAPLLLEPPATVVAPGDGDLEAPSPPSLPGWRGELRSRPQVRIGAGLGLALLLGYLLSQPYANRAERRVQELRAEADRERYLNADDARQRVATLDAAADGKATSGALGAGAIWLLVAGAAFAGWWKLT